MLGSIIGDIVGSVYEFNNYRAKDFAPFFHPKADFMAMCPDHHIKRSMEFESGTEPIKASVKH